MVNGAFAVGLIQTETTGDSEEAERTRMKQEANDLAVNAVDLYKEGGHVIFPAFKTIE
jgi:hypothetical protein